MVRMRWIGLPALVLPALALLGCARETGFAAPGEACVRSTECMAGLACVGGTCTTDLSGLEGGMVPMPPMDAGPPMDSGMDASMPMDSGMDAGPPPPDGGPPPPRDSGPPDSGPPPMPDSGPPPMPDSGPPPMPDAGAEEDGG